VTSSTYNRSRYIALGYRMLPLSPALPSTLTISYHYTLSCSIYSSTERFASPLTCRCSCADGCVSFWLCRQPLSLLPRQLVRQATVDWAVNHATRCVACDAVSDVSTVLPAPRFQQHHSRHAIGRMVRSASRSASGTVDHAIGSTPTNYH
jgi:hypothetical protein